MTKLVQQYRSRGEFLSQVRESLTSNSVFLPMEPPFPKLDSTVEIDLSILGEGPILRGTAHVVECRIGHGGTGLVPGIGLRLVQLDPESRARLPALVEEARQRTASVLDLVESTFGRQGTEPLPEIFIPKPLPAKAPSEPASAARVASAAVEPAGAEPGRKTLFPSLRRRPGLPPRMVPLPVFSLMIAGALSSLAYLAYRPLVDYLGGYTPTDALAVVGASVVNDIPSMDIRPSVEPRERLGEEAGQASAPSPSAGVPVLEPLPPRSETDPQGQSQPQSEPVAQQIGKSNGVGNRAPQLVANKPDKQLRAFDRINLISWKETADGAIVTLWCNGQSRPADIIHQRLSGESPRELLKLRGVDSPYRYSAVATDLEAVPRIRTGFHPQPVANELHVVLDLARPNLRLTKIETDGTRIHLFLTTAPQAVKTAAIP